MFYVLVYSFFYKSQVNILVVCWHLYNNYFVIMHSVNHAVNSVQFSTYYKNIFCAATFDYGSWYHAGDLYLFHVVHKVSENVHCITVILTQ
jgi:hypothetical protein